MDNVLLGTVLVPETPIWCSHREEIYPLSYSFDRNKSIVWNLGKYPAWTYARRHILGNGCEEFEFIDLLPEVLVEPLLRKFGLCDLRTMYPFDRLYGLSPAVLCKRRRQLEQEAQLKRLPLFSDSFPNRISADEWEGPPILTGMQ